MISVTFALFLQHFNIIFLSCSIQNRNSVCEQNRTGGLEDRAVEQEHGLGFDRGLVAEVEDVTIGPQTADDGGTGWGVDGQALGTDGDFAIVADADPGALAPDIGPPGTRRSRAEDGTLLSQR